MSSEVIGCSPDVIAAPDRIYSPLYGATVELDGACFSSPQLVEAITDEDSVLMIARGTVHPACGVIQCGRVGLYCYEAVEAPITTIQVFQPLGFPADYVALDSNRTRCYYKPVFVKQVYENFAQYRSPDTTFVYGSYADVVTTDLCGTPYKYISCTGSNELVVIDTSGTVFDTILYNGECYSTPTAVLTVTGTDTVVAGTYVTEVPSGCSDVLCTGSNASGSSITYEDVETGQTVLVAFDHLDVGIPYYGVASHTVDSGIGLNTAGNITRTFQGSKLRDVIVNRVPSTGTLKFSIVSPGVVKKLYITNGSGETAYTIGPASSDIEISVTAGDKISVGIVSDKPNKPRLKRAVFMRISWIPVGTKMRNYHTAAVSYSGSTSIKAVGFCGLSNRSAYAFYGTLPTTNITSYPNPDTFVTVQGDGSAEYRLITCTAYGDATPDESFAEYAGEELTGPLTFKFYSARALQGAHGEMDVWLDTAGDFPDYLKVNDYTVLKRPDDWFRKANAVSDTKRRSVRVTTEDDSQVIRLPGIYKSATGRRLVVGGFPSTFLPPDIIGSGSIVYELTGTAYGLAYRILDDSETPTGNYWLTEDYRFWLAEDSSLIEME